MTKNDEKVIVGLPLEEDETPIEEEVEHPEIGALEEELEEVPIEEKPQPDKVEDATKKIVKAIPSTKRRKRKHKLRPPTVRERIPKFKIRVFNLFKRMKPGERELTMEEFGERMKLKDPDDIHAAALAWKVLFDEGKVPTPQFYKPRDTT